MDEGPLCTICVAQKQHMTCDPVMSALLEMLLSSHTSQLSHIEFVLMQMCCKSCFVCCGIQAAAHAAAGKVKPSSGTPRQATSNFMRPTEAFSKKAGAVTPSKEEDGFSSFVPN